MKYLLLLAAVFFTAAIPAHAKGSVSPGDALIAIETFTKDPSSKEGFAAGDTLLTFAKQSSSVHLSLSKKIVPWIKNDDVSDSDTRHMLLVAYLAGNIRSQLKSGKAEDDVYAGWQQVLATYAQLLEINSAAKISEVDDLKRKEADGRLKAYASEVSR